jgi:arylsulfatase A-like enzyme
MRTPNIDRLASEGALFERAFHTTPICSPNRASIVTASTRAVTASSTTSRATR